MHGLTVYSLGGVLVSWASLVFLTVAKNIPANEEDTGLSLGWGDSPGEEMAITSVSLPGKSTDRGAWRATVHGVTESDTAEQLNDNNPFRRAGNKTDSVQSSPVQSPVMSDSVQPHRLQHTRLPCPSQVQELTQTHVH